jgi:hypothetical protein
VKTQAQEILTQLLDQGWSVQHIASDELEWWASEMWRLESQWTRTGAVAYVTFLIDPQVSHTKAPHTDDDIWAVLVSQEKPTNRHGSANSFTMSLNSGWKKQLPALLEHLSTFR